MTVTKVSYSRTYPVDLIWEKIFVEASLAEGENVREALYECKRTVESFHFESNKAAQKKEEELKTKNIEPIIYVTPEEIYSCKQMEGEDGLKSYKAIAKTNPELQKAYDEQFKKLCK